jgi:hypothetical protein
LFPRESISEPILVPQSVLDDWDLGAALWDTYPGNLLPSRAGWWGAQNRSDQVVAILLGRAATGYPAQRTEIVRVAKGDGTTRPAADLPLEDQAVLSALAALIKSHIPEGFVSFTGSEGQSYGDFERSPFQDPDAR